MAWALVILCVASACLASQAFTSVVISDYGQTFDCQTGSGPPFKRETYPVNACNTTFMDGTYFTVSCNSDNPPRIVGSLFNTTTDCSSQPSVNFSMAQNKCYQDVRYPPGVPRQMPTTWECA